MLKNNESPIKAENLNLDSQLKTYKLNEDFSLVRAIQDKTIISNKELNKPVVKKVSISKLPIEIIIVKSPSNLKNNPVIEIGNNKLDEFSFTKENKINEKIVFGTSNNIQQNNSTTNINDIPIKAKINNLNQPIPNQNISLQQQQPIIAQIKDFIDLSQNLTVETMTIDNKSGSTVENMIKDNKSGSIIEKSNNESIKLKSLSKTKFNITYTLLRASISWPIKESIIFLQCFFIT